MPDSPKLRARRSRAHRAGDHSLCRPAYCPAAAAEAPDEGPGPIASALALFLASLDLVDDDPRATLAAVAESLAHGLDRHATASVAHELRGLIAELQAPESDEAGRAQGARMLNDLKEMLR